MRRKSLPPNYQESAYEDSDFERDMLAELNDESSTGEKAENRRCTYCLSPQVPSSK